VEFNTSSWLENSFLSATLKMFMHLIFFLGGGSMMKILQCVTSQPCLLLGFMLHQWLIILTNDHIRNSIAIFKNNPFSFVRPFIINIRLCLNLFCINQVIGMPRVILYRAGPTIGNTWKRSCPIICKRALARISSCFLPHLELTAESVPLRELFEKHPFLPYNKNGNFTVGKCY